MPVFEYLAREKELSDFSGIVLLVDVAGGHGAVLCEILKQHPRMHGVLFDLEHVVQGAGARIETAGVKKRLETRRSSDGSSREPGSSSRGSCPRSRP
jgi:hypothetical protein